MDDLTVLIKKADKKNEVLHMDKFYDFVAQNQVKGNVYLRDVREARFTKKIKEAVLQNGPNTNGIFPR